jgi:hypothetical protein
MAQALKLDDSKEVRTLDALVAVESGNRARTLDLCEELDKHSPSATFIQKYWLPVLRGRVAIDQGNPGKAIQLLSPSLPTEMSSQSVLSTPPTCAARHTFSVAMAKQLPRSFKN